MLPQKLLASRFCPSAPVFAPRLLRTAAPHVVLAPRCSTITPSLGLQRLTYATYPTTTKFRPTISNSHKKPYKSKRVRNINDETTDMLQEFRKACDARNPQKILELYPVLREAKVFTRHDTRQIAQTLHTIVRNIRFSDVKISELLPFVRQFVEDIQEGLLPPHHFAFVHLLTLYKECKRYEEGYQLWQWLAEQDDTYVSQAAYGAAIELLAYGGVTSLPKLEALYHEALKRFPGTFAEYHLSPNAIVPDKTQPTVITGLPITLLQGILTARIQYRDWRNAYLAFDTALRLYPTQVPPRYFELFMTERPINEAYTAYLMACRAGMVFKPSHLSALITRLRAAMETSSSLYDRVLILRGIANAIYAYLEAGATLESIHVASLIRAFGTLLSEKSPQDEYRGASVQLRNLIAVKAHEILSGLTQAGLPLQPSPLIALIHLAGKLRVPDLLTTTVQDAKIAKVPLGPVGIRTALVSAGMLGNTELIKEFWSSITSTAETGSEQIPYEDWISFMRACKSAQYTDYFKDQLSQNQHSITSRIEKQLVGELEMPHFPSKEHYSLNYKTPAGLGSELEAVKRQMANVQAVVMSGQPLDIQNSPFYMHLDPDRPPLSSMENLRAIYDEMTTDPYQPPAQQPREGSPIKPVLSPTGLSLDELRFRNWVSILHMMDDAEIYESNFQAELDWAIRSGKPRPKETEVLRLQKGNGRKPIQTKDQLRERIRALRGSDLIGGISFRQH